MKIINQNKNSTTIEISSTEASALSNSMNEALEAVDDFEFQTHLGVTKEELQKLLKEFAHLA